MVQGLLLPLAAACLAVVASALASRLARWLADMVALSRLPHPPATCFWRGVCAAGDLAFHRSLTKFAAQYGGIYSIRFYHLKARGPAWRTGLPLSWPCLAAAKLPLSWLCFAALLCSSHRAALAARSSTEASRCGLSSSGAKRGRRWSSCPTRCWCTRCSRAAATWTRPRTPTTASTWCGQRRGTPRCVRGRSGLTGMSECSITGRRNMLCAPRSSRTAGGTCCRTRRTRPPGETRARVSLRRLLRRTSGAPASHSSLVCV